MFPLRDENPTTVFAWVTLVFIAVNLFVFFEIQLAGTAAEQELMLYESAAIGCEITTGQPLSEAETSSGECSTDLGEPVAEEKNVYLAIFTSMFLHGGLGHLLFNMWFLWLFGNNVEEAYGHFRYAALYLVGGIVATMVFVVMNPASTVPLVGASGAIAAVMGAYGVLFPKHQITTLLGRIVTRLPAFLYLAIWFGAQFMLGGSNTAWEAHVGGFAFGALVSLAFRSRLLLHSSPHTPGLA
ncbi:MAG: rhomboid family intramembrane serine protease [Acidimicrobiia bacterium]